MTGETVAMALGAEKDPFLRDLWYMPALSSSLGRGQMRREMLLGEPVVLYRREDGSPVALEDRCVHRLAPLSLGRVEGDRIRCLYHGFQFDADGTCREIPGQDMIPDRACVKAYPVVEKNSWVWVWMGDPARADPALLPDLHWNTDPAWEGDGDTLFAKCDYRLFLDNLMDLTHETFVHATSIGHQAIAHTPASTGVERATVSTSLPSSRTMSLALP